MLRGLSIAVLVIVGASYVRAADPAPAKVAIGEPAPAFQIKDQAGKTIDLAELTTMADYFVICSGGSERQIAAIADGIVGGLRDEGVRPIGREGLAVSHWVLVDYGSVIVHVFTPPERDFYQLEKHWSEAKTVLRVQ